MNFFRKLEELSERQLKKESKSTHKKKSDDQGETMPQSNHENKNKEPDNGGKKAPSPKISPKDPGTVQKIIKNQTARRIEIMPTEEGDPLIIPPFGSRTLAKEILNKYKYDAWEKQNLIRTDDPPSDPDGDSKLAIPGCLMGLFILFLLVTIPMTFISTVRLSWRFVGIGAGIFIVLIIVGFFNALRDDKASKEGPGFSWGQFFKHLLNLMLILAIGLGLPALVVYFFGGGLELLVQMETTNLAFLGRGLQLGYIAIASTLPALMYFMFGRQQLEKLRDNFIREVMMLDPNVQTTSEARTKYDPLFDSIYGSGNTPLGPVPIYICTLLTVFGWILVLMPIGKDLRLDTSGLVALLMPNAVALNYGFLGAYFFAINMVFRRYVRADLTPKTYTHISIRFLITAILVWVVRLIPNLLGIGISADSSSILVLAFIIGIIPETGTTLLQDFYRRTFGKILDSLKEEHPLTNLEGVNLYDRARLLEEGIENIENLAHHNLVELIVRTRIPTPRLVDLFDQAVLYLHLGLKADKLLETRQQLREYGIRTATDLVKVQEELPDLLKDQLPALVDKLKVISSALRDDEWMEYVEHWRKSTMRSEIPITQPHDFYILLPDRQFGAARPNG